MMNFADICIYGDSLMKGTIPVQSRYKFTIGEYLDRLTQRLPLKIVNRAKFGAYVSKGESMLRQDLERSNTARYTLLEYGGNDCNFDWAAISADPDGEHRPKTPLDAFLRTLEGMADALLEAGSQPVLMTLPPIDAEKYLDSICADARCDRRNILRWLGDANMIYRYHELYSSSIEKLAIRRGLPIVDVRTRFLDKHNYRSLISEDGIHPSQSGYDIMYSAFNELLSTFATPRIA